MKLQEDQAEGLRGLTEVGMSKQAERERAAKAELVEKVNKYLGGLDASDEYKVTSVDLWLTPAQENENLRQQARNNTPADFARSPELRVVLEDSVWRHNDLSEKFAKLLQDMPTDELVSLAMAAGFYERLRGQAG